MKKDYASPLPKRFYAEVTVEKREGGFAVLLDGRLLKTIAKQPLVLPNESLAKAVAAEWAAVEQVIVPDAMPLTRLAHIAIDRMGRERAAVMEQALMYAETDLLCHRGGDAALRQQQAEVWDAILHGLEPFGIRMVTTVGVIPVLQPQDSISKVRELLESADDWQAAALAMLVPLLGSVLLAIALWKRVIAFDAALNACRLDEAYQQARWGVDAEEDALWQAKVRDMRAAAQWLGMLAN